MQSLWKKAVFCALILTSCLPVSAMNTTGKQPQERSSESCFFRRCRKETWKMGRHQRPSGSGYSHAI